MPNREHILYEKTYKGQVDELEKRVFYTPTGEEKLSAHRVAKAVALLVKALSDKKLLTDDEIDALLLESIF